MTQKLDQRARNFSVHNPRKSQETHNKGTNWKKESTTSQESWKEIKKGKVEKIAEVKRTHNKNIKAKRRIDVAKIKELTYNRKYKIIIKEMPARFRRRNEEKEKVLKSKVCRNKQRQMKHMIKE